MKGVVDHSLACGLFHPIVECFPQGLALVLGCEVYEGCCATECCRDRAGLKIVGAGCAAEGHIEMRVHVDSARHHELSLRIDHASGAFYWQSCADHLDPALCNADI